MKQCDYCGKPIDYHHQYCCEECEKNAIHYYNRERRSEKLISFVNIISFFGVIAGCIIAAIYSGKIGCFVCAPLLALLGCVYFICPFAPENITKKYKIIRAQKFIRLFAIIFLAIAVILLALAIFLF